GMPSEGHSQPPINMRNDRMAIYPDVSDILARKAAARKERARLSFAERSQSWKPCGNATLPSGEHANSASRRGTMRRRRTRCLRSRSLQRSSLSGPHQRRSGRLADLGGRERPAWLRHVVLADLHHRARAQQDAEQAVANASSTSPSVLARKTRICCPTARVAS